MKEQLRRLLAEQARSSGTVTYAELAERLGLTPPGAIQRVGNMLEALMREDAAAGRPLLSAVCVSKARRTLPAQGFFLAARKLGLFDGDSNGSGAQAFHARELQRVRDYYCMARELPSAIESWDA